MNPQLTCSQHQWLHSSVGRASHQYREVTGSNLVEVLNFFQASLRNCTNCVHCDDHFFIFVEEFSFSFLIVATNFTNTQVQYTLYSKQPKRGLLDVNITRVSLIWKGMNSKFASVGETEVPYFFQL